MDVSRRDRDRVYQLGPRGSIRITKFSAEEEQDPPSIASPYAQMDRPRSILKGQFYSTNSNSGISSSRRYRGEHPYLMRSPVPDDDVSLPPNSIPSIVEQRHSMRSPANDDDPTIPPNNIPPLLPSENNVNSGPRPLFSDDVIQKLRESLRKTAARHDDLRSEWEDYDENTYSPPVETERMTYEEYLEEEEKTKQTIDEIIMVAQALRDKIDREKKMRRAAMAASLLPESSNSRAPLLGVAPRTTANPQPKIPSLLDLHVEPPEEILMAQNRYEPEYYPEYQEIEVCWNCDKRGHRFINCKYPKLRNFCYRCGKRGYDLVSCPICNV